MRRSTTHVHGWWLGLLATIALVAIPFDVAFGWAPEIVRLALWGVMFCWAGWAASSVIERTDGKALPTLLRGVRGILIPLWILMVVMVLIAWFEGSLRSTFATSTWAWFAPLITPRPTAGLQWGATLRVLTPLLWCALATPILYWFYGRWPRILLALPLAVLALHTGGLVQGRGLWGVALFQTMPLLTCWMVGFGARNGSLHRWPLGRTLGAGAALVTIAWAWAYVFPDDVGNHTFTQVQLAGALAQLGLTLILARASFLARWLIRVPLLRMTTRWTTARAMTLIVWADLVAWAATTDVMPDWFLNFFADYLGEGAVYVAQLSVFLLATLLTAGTLESLLYRRAWLARLLRRRRVTKGLHETSPPPHRFPALSAMPQRLLSAARSYRPTSLRPRFGRQPRLARLDPGSPRTDLRSRKFHAHVGKPARLPGVQRRRK